VKFNVAIQSREIGALHGCENVSNLNPEGTHGPYSTFVPLGHTPSCHWRFL